MHSSQFICVAVRSNRLPWLITDKIYLLRYFREQTSVVRCRAIVEQIYRWFFFNWCVINWTTRSLNGKRVESTGYIRKRLSWQNKIHLSGIGRPAVGIRVNGNITQTEIEGYLIARLINLETSYRFTTHTTCNDKKTTPACIDWLPVSNCTSSTIHDDVITIHDSCSLSALPTFTFDVLFQIYVSHS